MTSRLFLPHTVIIDSFNTLERTYIRTAKLLLKKKNVYDLIYGDWYECARCLKLAKTRIFWHYVLRHFCLGVGLTVYHAWTNINLSQLLGDPLIMLSVFWLQFTKWKTLGWRNIEIKHWLRANYEVQITHILAFEKVNGRINKHRIFKLTV